MNTLAAVALVTLLQTGPAAAHDLLADVQRIAAAETNDARFETLTAMLRARKLGFVVEPFTLDAPVGQESRKEGRNVVVTLGEGTEQVIVGAHYDAARLPDGTLSRGAVDNAASTVILIRLAERLRDEELAVSVKVVWFDMEELGLIGSGRYVQTHSADRIVAMLNFDINASGDTVLFGPSDAELNARLRRLLLQTCADQGRDCMGFPQMPPGDDRSFVRAKLPTLSIAQLPAAEAHELWLLMNAKQESDRGPRQPPAILQTIHTKDDTPAKVDGASMDRVLRFALALVRRVAARQKN